MLRHACGYALADRGADTRLIQDYLGHTNIQHTVRYTATLQDFGECGKKGAIWWDKGAKRVVKMHQIDKRNELGAS